MLKRIFSLFLIVVAHGTFLCSAIPCFTDKEFDEKCRPYINECIEMANSKGQSSKWEEFSKVENGEKDYYYRNIYSGAVFPTDCVCDDHMLQIVERSRYSHNGLNFEIDRNEANMRPVSGTRFTYEIFGSKDRYQEVGQRLLKSVADAKKRLNERRIEIDLDDKLSNDQSELSFSDFFVPYNKKAAVAVALGAGTGAFLVMSDAKSHEKRTGEKSSRLKSSLWMTFFYVASNIFANMFAKPHKKLLKPYLDDTKYREYRMDLWLKREAVCDFYAALTGESTHCSFSDDSLSKEKTLSGLPLNKAIEEFGFVLDLPGKPEDIWYKYYDDISKDITLNPGNADVYAQNERYERLVRDFGEEFVKTGDMSKLKLRKKDSKK